MAPHGSALPKPATESAKAARRAFFCELCQKGYARMNEFEAHEGSYDHQHRKRLKDMKSLTRDPALNSSSARQTPSTGSKDLRSISLPSKGMAQAAGVKKKPIFRTVGAVTSDLPGLTGLGVASLSSVTEAMVDESGAVRNGWASAAYDPGVISGCESGCMACDGSGIVI